MTTIMHAGTEFRFFDHLYAVSENGEVFFIKTQATIPGNKRKDGYTEIGRQRLRHRMVATCWVPNPNNAKHVHHKNHDKSDDRAENLEWVTPKEHFGERHKGAHGHYVRTEKTRQKLREYRTGRTTSNETKAKQRDANIRLGIRPPAPKKGTKRSAAERLAMSLNSPNATRCQIDGVVYRSFNEAGAALNIKPHTVRKRCYSSNFVTYQLLEG
ncbi:MAG: HNH endonuclease [Pseudaminobacter sp.]